MSKFVIPILLNLLNQVVSTARSKENAVKTESWINQNSQNT